MVFKSSRLLPNVRAPASPPNHPTTLPSASTMPLLSRLFGSHHKNHADAETKPLTPSPSPPSSLSPMTAPQKPAHGLTPPSLDGSVHAVRCLEQLRAKDKPIEKHIYLSQLKLNDENMFYYLCINNLSVRGFTCHCTPGHSRAGLRPRQMLISAVRYLCRSLPH